MKASQIRMFWDSRRERWSVSMKLKGVAPGRVWVGGAWLEPDGKNYCNRCKGALTGIAIGNTCMACFMKSCTWKRFTPREQEWLKQLAIRASFGTDAQPRLFGLRVGGGL